MFFMVYPMIMMLCPFINIEGNAFLKIIVILGIFLAVYILSIVWFFISLFLMAGIHVIMLGKIKKNKSLKKSFDIITSLFTAIPIIYLLVSNAFILEKIMHVLQFDIFKLFHINNTLYFFLFSIAAFVTSGLIQLYIIKKRQKKNEKKTSQK